MNPKIRHHEESTIVDISPMRLFAYVDDHARFASHMNSSSWMMGGGHMNTQVDTGRGQRVGSHIQMDGKILGINLYLDEVVTQYEPPYLKIWKTVGDINLLIIGHYQMGFKIEEERGKSLFTVFINYKLPQYIGTRWLGYLLGGVYAKWCVKQMLSGPTKYFNHNNKRQNYGTQS
ncbi:MAG: SRPBCC family protein [Candidatus Paceibacterota bacterium]|jgi:hypothetical protein